MQINLKNSNDSEQELHVRLSISTRSIIRLVISLVIFIGAILLLRKLSSLIFLLLIAFILTLALNAPISRLSHSFPGRLRGSRVIATSLSYLIVVVILGAFLSYIIPPLIHQTDHFIKEVPSLVSRVQTKNNSLGNFIRRHGLQNEVNVISKDLTSWLASLGTHAFSSLTSILSSFLTIIALLVLTFMMSIEGPQWLKLIDKYFVPKDYQQNVRRISQQMYLVIKGFVNGQVVLATIAAVVLLPGLLIFHISYPIALMVIVFLSGLIPMIGHTIGAIILTVIGLFHSPLAGLGILIYYLVYMLIENYILQPRIQANNTRLSPLIVFISLLAGLEVAGLLGGLIAIPIVACLRIMLVEYLNYRNKLLKVSS